MPQRPHSPIGLDGEYAARGTTAATIQVVPSVARGGDVEIGTGAGRDQGADRAVGRRAPLLARQPQREPCYARSRISGAEIYLGCRDRCWDEVGHAGSGPNTLGERWGEQRPPVPPTVSRAFRQLPYSGGDYPIAPRRISQARGSNHDRATACDGRAYERIGARAPYRAADHAEQDQRPDGQRPLRTPWPPRRRSIGIEGFSPLIRAPYLSPPCRAAPAWPARS